MNRRSGFRSWERRLFAPVDIAFLAWFRVLFGIMLVWIVWVFFQHGLIASYYIVPEFHFKYYGFEWVEPLPPDGMHVLFGVMGFLGASVTVGLFGRLAVALYGMAFTYTFLLERANYMNHFYLMNLLCGLLAVMPSQAALSVDAWLRPGIRRATVPAWMLWLLRFQFGVVYFYAGLAKLHPDWLSGQVMGMMLATKDHLPAVVELSGERWFTVSLSYASLVFDLSVTPLLLWRRTRLYAVAAAIAFHLCNAVLFTIDVFPWMMIGGTVVLFAPDWLPRLRTATANAAATDGERMPTARKRKVVLALLAIYVFIQIIVPLRTLVYPGDAAWTEEGQAFAWRMLMRKKHGLPPTFPVSYVFEGQRYETELPVPKDEFFWEMHWQARRMLIDPDMILQFVHMKADELRSKGAEDVNIRAIVHVSLNGHEPQLLIDPTVNLAEIPRSLRHKEWLREFVRDDDRPASDTPP